MPIFTVSQVTQYLRESLEGDPILADLWVSGEVSNLHPSQAGHNYFTLKDSHGRLRSVVFKSGRGAGLLIEGSLVTAHGRVSFYEARGDIQLIADLVMPEGTGPLHLELERLKARLEAEGLFEPSRKRPLPIFPKVIGLVTSPSGAVLHDILNIVGRRFPLVEILLAPCQVQGEGAAMAVASALQALNDEGSADVIIVARGGGSMEELWPFNEETVARAVHGSRIPVVSAVGHETDYTIADYVADVRAPTPSAAAEMAVPDAASLGQDIRGCSEAILRCTSSYLSRRRQELGSIAGRLKMRAPGVDTSRRRVDDLAKESSDALSGYLTLWRERVDAHQHRLEALNPNAILQRGYAVIQKRPDGQPVYRKGQVTQGEGLDATVSDGTFMVTVGGPQRKPIAKKDPVRAGARLL